MHCSATPLAQGRPGPSTHLTASGKSDTVSTQTKLSEGDRKKVIEMLKAVDGIRKELTRLLR